VPVFAPDAAAFAAATGSNPPNSTPTIACISVIAFSPELYTLIREQLSADQFKAFYRGVIAGAVTRHEAPDWTRCNSSPRARSATASRAA